MTDTWASDAERLGSDLHLELSDPQAGAGRSGRRAALVRALRTAVRTGRLAPGTRLPPYRSLAADLGMARNTVADAYAELIAEGWLTARQGSGTRVADRIEPLTGPRPVTPPSVTALPARPSAAVRAPAAVRAGRPLHDLRPGSPAAASFPRGAWLTSYRRALHAAPSEAFGPGDPQGRIELRQALTGYLARARGVRADPERIVICSGFGHALRLLYCVPGRPVLRGPLAVEAYGLPYHHTLLTEAGVRTVPLPLDEHGARVEELVRDRRPRAVLLTPAHQFPTGGRLRPERRAAVVDWARNRGGLVLEDDYDSEFRFDRRPVGAVQGLDPERVIHLGSVSKSLSPALRIGWMVLPEHLVGRVLAVKGVREVWAGVMDQLALADFIESGGYDRHVRRMRQRYRRRRDQLLAALATRAPHLAVTGMAAGLHAVLQLPPGTEPAVLRAAQHHGVAVEGLAAFRHRAAAMPAPDGLVVGFGTPPEHAYEAALDALCRALPES